MRRKNIVILLGAGRSERMKMPVPKQFAKIQEKYLYEYCISNFLDVNLIDNIILVVNENHLQQVKNYVSNKYKMVHVCSGGDTRKNSLDKAINYVKSLFYKEIMNINIISHDVARIFVNRRIIEENIKALDTHDVVNTVFPFSDSLAVIENRVTIDYPNRNVYYHVQTPQSFRLDQYIIANFKKIDNSHHIDDVVKMFFLNNKSIYNVVGEKINFKITEPTDLKIAESIIKRWV